MVSPLLPPVIAIDGPSASGKGTLALHVARALGFHYLESGALYRVVAHAALREGVPLTDAARLAALSARLDPEFRAETILLDGVDVSQAIRAEACGNAASQLAAYPGVRAALLERQRRFRQPPGLVAEGRDMGTVVFPDATLKVYLTASAQVRADRRHKQLMAKGIHANLAAILQDIERRDARDVSRAAAPLQKAADAFVVDSTALSIDQMTQAVIDRYREIRAQRAD